MRKRLLEARRLFKSYDGESGPVWVLTGLDLVVSEGELVAIYGPAGAGKSTLLRILGLWEYPTAGDLLFEGRFVTSLSETERSSLRQTEILLLEGCAPDSAEEHAKVLLLDEPAAGSGQNVLDQDVLARLMASLHRMSAAGQALVLTTPDPAVAAGCGLVYRLNQGVLQRLSLDIR